MQVSVDPGSWLNLTNLYNFNGVEFWGPTNYPDIPFSNDDTYIQLTQNQARRLDLLAFEFYGNSQLMWIILQANNLDLPNQVFDGMVLRLPSKDTVNQILATATAA